MICLSNNRARPGNFLRLGFLLFALSLLRLSAQNSLIVFEDFESYTNTESMRLVWKGNSGELVDAPGGGKAVAHDGANVNRFGGFLVSPDDTHDLVLSADFYDFATNRDKRVLVSLRQVGGQCVDLGLTKAALYAAHVSGFGARSNWVSFKRGQQPVQGWHRLRAVISTTNVAATLALNPDGAIDRRINIPVTEPLGAFAVLRFGGMSRTPTSGGPVLLDNIRLELVPKSPPPELAAIQPPAAPLPTNDAPLAPAPRLQPEKPAAMVLPQNELRPSIVAPNAGASFEKWVFGALAIIGCLLIAILVMLKRRTAVGNGPLLASSPTVPQLTEGGSNGHQSWERRALLAEELVAKQAQILNEKVGPELKDFAKQALVQGLYTQRNALLETQRRAQQALAELEERITGLQLPQRERIQVYAKRIAELEKQLETRDEELRELTRATLLLVRQRLEREQAETA